LLLGYYSVRIGYQREQHYTEVVIKHFFKNMPNNIFFVPTPSKKAKNIRKYDVHAKHHFFHAKPF